MDTKAKPAKFPVSEVLYAGIPAYNDLRGITARIKEYSPIKTSSSVIKLVLIALTGQQSLKKAKTRILYLAK